MPNASLIKKGIRTLENSKTLYKSGAKALGQTLVEEMAVKISGNMVYATGKSGKLLGEMSLKFPKYKGYPVIGGIKSRSKNVGSALLETGINKFGGLNTGTTSGFTVEGIKHLQKLESGGFISATSNSWSASVNKVGTNPFKHAIIKQGTGTSHFKNVFKDPKANYKYGAQISTNTMSSSKKLIPQVGSKNSKPTKTVPITNWKNINNRSTISSSGHNSYHTRPGQLSTITIDV